MQPWRILLAFAVLGVSASATADDQPITSMRLDREFVRKVDGNCRYSASIHGTVVPVNAPSAAQAKGTPMVKPELQVEAAVACPRAETIKIADNVMATGPLTHEQLARAIERRASVLVVGSRERCVYVPELTLDGNDLELTKVDRYCPTSK